MNNFVKNKNKILGYMINIFLCVILPGFLIAYFGIKPYFKEDESTFILYGILIPLLSYYLIYTFSFIFHELGHLFYGIKHNFKINEFNFLLFSFYKENNHLSFKIRKTYKGTFGYCEIDIPDKIIFEDYKAYAFGGIIFDFILVIVGLILFFIFDIQILKLDMLLLISINLGIALLNMIPFELNGVDTDGSKIYKMKKDLHYISNLNKLTKVNKMIKSGVSIDKIPDELIYIPKKIEYQSDLDAMNIYISKLLCLKNYSKAEELINMGLNSDIITPNTKNNFQISLIDLYLYTNQFNKIESVYDDKLVNFIINVSMLEKGTYLYLIIYYIFKHDTKNMVKVNNKFLDYLKSLDKNSPIYIELNNLYNHIDFEYSNHNN